MTSSVVRKRGETQKGKVLLERKKRFEEMELDFLWLIAAVILGTSWFIHSMLKR